MSTNRHLKLPFSGYTLITVLVFVAIFTVVFGGLAGYLLFQSRVQSDKEAQAGAFEIAEAGLDYYRWHLAHYPTDVQDGTGHAGPYEHEVFDPEGAAIGRYSLVINGNQVCGETTSVDIYSTGWTYKNPLVKKVVHGKYARPTVAEYSYIVDNDVAVGSDRIITGPYHSNGGIRMMGTNNSTMTSAQATWDCTASYYCNGSGTNPPPNPSSPGVTGPGTGAGYLLWRFPVPVIDFTKIKFDIGTARAKAIAGQGLYFGPSPNGKGYKVVFNGDGTFDIWRAVSVDPIRSFEYADGWQNRDEIVKTVNHLGSYTPVSGCEVIYVEDDVWLEGTIKGKMTLIAADMTGANTKPSIILSGNINYTTLDGSDGLAAVAEYNVRVPLNSPNNLITRGIFIAQTGVFGRNNYRDADIPAAYNPYKGNGGTVGGVEGGVKRNSMRIFGTVVSKGRVGTKWTGGGGVWISGYGFREDTYDRKLAPFPPPMTPYTSSEYKFTVWDEK